MFHDQTQLRFNCKKILSRVGTKLKQSIFTGLHKNQHSSLSTEFRPNFIEQKKFVFTCKACIRDDWTMSLFDGFART